MKNIKEILTAFPKNEKIFCCTDAAYCARTEIKDFTMSFSVVLYHVK